MMSSDGSARHRPYGRFIDNDRSWYGAHRLGGPARIAPSRAAVLDLGRRRRAT